MFVRSPLLFLAVVAMLALNTSCATGDELVNPVTARGLIEEFIGLGFEQRKSINTDMYSRKNPEGISEFFLVTEIVNDSNRAICIPSIFFDSKNLIALSSIISGKVDGSKNIDRLGPLPKISWPTTNYVILSPSSSLRRTFNLSRYFDLKSVEKVIEIKYQIPAFKCQIFESGYPVTFNKYQRPFGLDERLPLEIADKLDIFLFEGSATYIVD